MKKVFILCAVMCGLFLGAMAQVNTGPDMPSYNVLRQKAFEASQSEDYETTYKTFQLMDSVYGITCNDFVSLMNLRAMTHYYNPGSEAEKALLIRLAGCKCFDKADLKRDAEWYRTDTLDYWNEVEAIVSSRSYQDTVYQNRLLAMKRADQAVRQLLDKRYDDKDSLWTVLREIEARNEAELKRLIAERGFPTWTKVGYLCNDMATYIAQFASKDFLHWYLREAQAAIDSGDYTSSSWFDYIVDHEDINRTNLNVAYKDELKAMCDKDQRLRHEISKDQGGSNKLWQEVRSIDSLNTARLQDLIAQYGFPTYNNVGHQGVDDAALLAQHANPEFLHWFLEQARPAADNGVFDLSWIAMMTDRDRNHQVKPQLYGSQLVTIDDFTAFKPIEDIANLNARRASMGLGPIEDYMAIYGLTELVIHPAKVPYNQYYVQCRMDSDTLRVSGIVYFSYENKEKNYLLLSQTAKIDSLGIGEYQRNGDTITFSGNLVQFPFTYSLPLNDYRTADGAIVLRREGNWYPHRNGEILTVKLQFDAEGYYMITNAEKSLGSRRDIDLHLILLPKDRYECKVVGNDVRPFHFYRNTSDTAEHPEAFYREFVDSYQFYCQFFGDTLSHQPMNIVEIGDPQFVMCQSLRDMIIFGPYFLQVYKMIPDFSWVPHEVVHQWWGNSIFFAHRDYALSESITEYIKLQFLKSRGRGYEEQIGYYEMMAEYATQSLAISDIRSVESQDESIAIYHKAPLQLEKMKRVDVSALLKQLYDRRNGTVVSRDVFLEECAPLKKWLMAK
ncbi:MAG: hypothetical protein K5864_07745 [Bacteroidales bacterium]|nr:hypothetical protein [Bacteroidales bacterium]